MLERLTDVRLSSSFYWFGSKGWCWFAWFCVFCVKVGCCCVVHKMLFNVFLVEPVFLFVDLYL